MKRLFFSLMLTAGFLFSESMPAEACTNFLVTKGASKDGSTMITYAADSHVLYGELYFRPAKDYPKGSIMKVYEWDTGKYLCEIPQAEHTYSVIGNVNEHQVAIGETTYGGRHELQDTIASMDYGNLMYITLQRAKTAREAIKIMTGIVDKYGFCSHGESFSIADPNEVWILEMIGKGPGNTGAIWVARMVPDGYVCAHANQARITTFPKVKENNWFNKEQTTFHSKDIISFAREQGYFDGKDEEFSFSDTYAPVDFGGTRFCEIRVWAFFDDVASGMDEYWEYAKGNIEHGKHGYASNRIPLWIKPDEKIDVHTVMDNMRNHLEGTELDMRDDIGAGPFDKPYRWRPLTWEVDGKTYVNERATATQQTGFSFVAQLKSWMPDPVGGINWFSVDDAATTVYVPIICGSTQVPDAYAVGNGSMMEFEWDAAFWVFNLVSNFAYTRYNVIQPEIREVQLELEKKYIREVKEMENEMKKLYKENPEMAIAKATKYSVNTGNATVKRWQELFKYLFTKYMDGNVKKKAAPKENYKYVAPELEQPGYGEEWYRRIIEDTGDQFLMPEEEDD
ncbi:MAG: C69 family dipeptidase [Bacteroidota bacterium]|nr:C69 family dipeptidase [Bacteroidota bacterium]